MRLNANLVFTILVVGLGQISAKDDQPINLNRRFISDALDEDISATDAPPISLNWKSVIPSAGPNYFLLPAVDPSLYKRNGEVRDDRERELDRLGGSNLFQLRYDRYARAAEGQNNDENKPSRLKKRALDTLGSMQVFGYKRGFDTLGGTNLHSGYKRFLSSLGGSQIHNYKRFDSLGGTNLHSFKRLSSLGGNNIYDYKRALSSLGGSNLHSGYKRYLSSLGGRNIYDYKRSMDTLNDDGAAEMHDGGYKRFLSSLGGANIHSGGAFKRTLSSLGGVNLHGGYGYKRNEGGVEMDDEK